MTLRTIGDVESALSTAKSVVVTKSISTSVTSSGWRSGGSPGAGAIPTSTVEMCTNATVGAVPIIDPPVGLTNYLLEVTCGTTGVSQIGLLLSDRLAHMGGLSAIVLTTQNVGIDVSGPEYDARRGSADYSDLEWWLECYVATGATSKVLDVACLYGDGNPGVVQVTIPGSMPAGRLVQIIPATGKYIKSVTSVFLSSSTGTAGNFGVTVSRPITQATPKVNETVVLPWAKTGLQKIPLDTCLMMFCYSASGTVNSYVTLRYAAR